LIKYALLSRITPKFEATNTDYGKMIRETEAFSPEAEAILKENFN
jgi:hypothetical protein